MAYASEAVHASSVVAVTSERGVQEMEPLGSRSPRERMSIEVKNIRQLLEGDATGVAVSAASVTPTELERLTVAGGGVMGCILLTIAPQERDSAMPPPAFDPRRNDQMINITLQLLASGVRTSDVLVRMGGQEVVCLLPGTGPLEARGVGWRLRSMIEGREFWFEEKKFRMTCKAGLASRAARGGGDDLRGLCDAARRNPITS